MFDGLDLTPWIRDPGLPPPDRLLHLESLHAWRNHGWAPQFGCTRGPLKYLRSAREELYDRAADPAESHNLFVEGEPRAVALARQLAAHQAAAQPSARATTTLSDADRRLLEALGYGAGGGSGVELPDDWIKLPDTYLKLPEYHRVAAAFSAAAAQGSDAMIAVMRAALVDEPQSAPLHEQLARTLLWTGGERVAEAAVEFDAALRIDARRARSWCGRAECAIVAGEPAGIAEAALRQALDCDPNYPDALTLLADLLLVRGERLLQKNDGAAAALPVLHEADELLRRLADSLLETTPERALASTKRAQLRGVLKQIEPGGAAGERVKK